MNSTDLPAIEPFPNFEALSEFANMGDSTENWQTFRLRNPEFFPIQPLESEFPEYKGLFPSGYRCLTDLIYAAAEQWAAGVEPWATPNQQSKTPLIWYRDALRAAWTNNDRTGGCLYVLYGYEAKARQLGISLTAGNVIPLYLPNLPNEIAETAGLPQGEPVIDGITGKISWSFGCKFQQAVYELMQCRWKARVCVECGRFFVASKTAQTFCSGKCSTMAKRKRSLEYWNRVGSAERDKRKKGGKRK